jgi:hypothetical protein
MTVATTISNAIKQYYIEAKTSSTGAAAAASVVAQLLLGVRAA